MRQQENENIENEGRSKVNNNQLDYCCSLKEQQYLSSAVDQQARVHHAPAL
jgi:hypothetical protein